MMHKILIIEDDEILSDTLSDFFVCNGLEVFTANSGAQGIQNFIEKKPHLVLLDVILPDTTGFEIIQKIRKYNTSVPVIFMTGSEFDSASQVKGFESGAVNYIPKPVIPVVLLAQIKQLINSESINVFDCGAYQITIDKQLIKINGTEIQLREKDALLLKLLLNNKNSIVSRNKIMETLWNDVSNRRNNQLDGSVSRIKKILSDFPCIDILSVYGQGYELKVG